MRHATATNNSQNNNNSQAVFSDLLKNISEGAQTALTSAKTFVTKLSFVSDAFSKLLDCISTRYTSFKDEHGYSDSTILKASAFAGSLMLTSYIGRGEIKAGFDIAKEFGYNKSDIAFNMMPEAAQSVLSTFGSYISDFVSKITSSEAGIVR